MHFSEKYKCYWFTPQRTGTRSTKELLRVLGFQTMDHHFTFDANKKDYFFVSNVRNPYSRLVSLFYLYSHHLNNFHKQFDTWVHDSINHLPFAEKYQFYYHENFQYLGKPFDKFVRQENLENDLKSISFIDLSIPDINREFEINIVNNRYKTEFEGQMNEKRKNWKEFYNQELADLVYEKFLEQFQLFGYHKDSWKYVTP